MSDGSSSNSSRRPAPTSDGSAGAGSNPDEESSRHIPNLTPLERQESDEIAAQANSVMSGSHYTVSSPVAHSLRRNSLVRIALQQEAHGNQAEFSLADSNLGGIGGSSSNSTAQRNDLNSAVGDDEEDDAFSSGDEEGALLRSKSSKRRQRAESRASIAAQYTKTLPPASKRDSCDFPTIFSSNEDELEAARSEEPMLGEWQLRAAAAVVRHRQSSNTVYASEGCGGCSLSFRDPQAEQAFHYYFSSLNEHKLRRRLLLLNFLYMIYATIEWGTRTSKHYSRSQQNWITVLRVFYILINAIIFTVSFIQRNFYRRNIHLLSTILAVLTSTLIIMEGYLLRNIYSPFVLLILIMYMVGSNIYVRTLFSVSSAVCWYNMILYNFMCLVFSPRGDLSTLHSTNDALLQLFYYDLILVFFILTIMFQTRKIEKQNRYAFLTYYIEVEQEEKERAEEEERRRKRKPEDEERKKRKSRGESISMTQEEVKEGHETSSLRRDASGAHETAAPVGPNGESGSKRPPLLPRNKAEELALLRELNAAEKAEDPFYLSRMAAMFLPQQKVTTLVPHKELEEAQRQRASQPTSDDSAHPGFDETTTMETVYSNDPLYTTLSIMRAKGITSMTEFVRLLSHQKKVAEASNKISEMPCLCCSNELPAWFTSYPYVLSKYRTFYTKEMCIRSMFEWHNETINIWTEFLPCLIFIIGFIVLEITDPAVFKKTTPAWDRFFVMIGFLFGLVLRPICSGLAHTFYPMSNRSFIIWWSIDYVSILLSIMGYALVMGRFTFFCMLSQQIFFYISVLVLFLSTIAAVLFVASPGIRTSSFLLYILFANGVPYIYQLVLTAADLEEHDVPKTYLALWTLMWCLMLLGLLIKSSMIPERWWPGRFDIFFASHQWWHLCINTGAAVAYFAWKSYLLWRPTAKCDPSYDLP